MRIERTGVAIVDRNLQNIAAELERLEALIPSGRTLPTYVSADYLVKVTDTLVIAQPQQTMNIMLPPSSALVGRSFTVKNAAAAQVSVNVRGAVVNGVSETVDGQYPYVMPKDTCLTLLSIGTGWEIV